MTLDIKFSKLLKSFSFPTTHTTTSTFTTEHDVNSPTNPNINSDDSDTNYDTNYDIYQEYTKNSQVSNMSNAKDVLDNIQSFNTQLDLETIEIEFHSDYNISNYWDSGKVRSEVDKIPDIYDIYLTEYNSCIFQMEPSTHFTELDAVNVVFNILWNLYHIPMCAYICSHNSVKFYPDKHSFEYSDIIQSIVNTISKEDPFFSNSFPHQSEHIIQYQYLTNYLFYKCYPVNKHV